MYTNQAFWTAAHDSIPVVYVIFNNASYRILKQRTLALKGFSAIDDRYVGMDLVNPAIDFVGLRGHSACRGTRREDAGHRSGAEARPGVGRPLPGGRADRRRVQGVRADVARLVDLTLRRRRVHT